MSKRRKRPQEEIDILNAEDRMIDRMEKAEEWMLENMGHTSDADIAKYMDDHFDIPAELILEEFETLEETGGSSVEVVENAMYRSPATLRLKKRSEEYYQKNR
jgi:hypothetical protein